MNTLCEDLQQEELGVKFKDFVIPSLLLADDVAVLAKNKKEMSKMLMVIEEFRKRNRPSLSKKKTKIMTVNNKAYWPNAHLLYIIMHFNGNII